MKLLASNKVVDSEYELAANDIRRIRTLMEDIDSQGIEFKYLITMNYPYRITDYTRFFIIPNILNMSSRGTLITPRSL